jgi:hypothetical protein
VSLVWVNSHDLSNRLNSAELMPRGGTHFIGENHVPCYREAPDVHLELRLCGPKSV